MNKFFAVLAAGVVLAVGSAQGAAVLDLYTVEQDWLDDVGAPDFIEPFDTTLTGDLSIVTNLGSLVAAPFQSGQPFVNDGAGVNLGNAFVNNDPNAYIRIGLDNGNPFYGMGFQYDLDPYEDGSGLQVYGFFEGGSDPDFYQLISLTALDDEAEGFFGFRSNTLLHYLEFRTNNSAAGSESSPAERERFNLWDLSVCEGCPGGDPPPPSVPEPSTFGLMGLALVGLGVARRRFRR